MKTTHAHSSEMLRRARFWERAGLASLASVVAGLTFFPSLPLAPVASWLHVAPHLIEQAAGFLGHLWFCAALLCFNRANFLRKRSSTAPTRPQVLEGADPR